MNHTAGLGAPQSLLLPQVRTLDLLILLLVKTYLLVDALQGFLQQQWALNLSLSAGYKSALMLLMLLSCGLTMGRRIALLPALLLFLLAGPVLSFFSLGHSAGLSYDIGMALKLVAPLLAAWYCYGLCQRDAALARHNLHQLMWLGFAIIVINLVLGRLGFGLSAYLPSDYFPDQLLGSKGFFKATNELSALLLVFSAYLFAWYWPRQKVIFALVLGFSLFCSSTLLTKTGNAGVLLLAVLIPLLQARAQWLPYRRFIQLAMGLGAMLLLLLAWQLPAILPYLPLSEKQQFVLAQQGAIGIVLSNRDLFVAENWFYVVRYFPDWQQLLGVGNAGLALYSSKPLAEIDPADLFIWFGVAGLSWYALWFAGVIRLALDAWRLAPQSVAAGVLMLNILLLVVASMAGHVLTSGMLWIPWGMLNGAFLLWQTTAAPDPSEANHAAQ
ncbi:O-antigen ligase family protein [Rheinheimera texasensis]|uniref:O-antigen ligase family protein n=1 Tax=Rheinheimera texasensis TaxID=306205 RepID=UPI0032B107C3